MRNKYTILSALVLSGCLVLTSQTKAQIVVMDPGHGYSASGGNPDGRTDTENSTALAVGLKVKALLQNECAGWTVHLTRSTRNGWISLSQRVQMSNSWGADRFISIHCNAGGGTGTETFWCTRGNATDARNSEIAGKVQSRMVQYGSWTNRRVVEDNTYLGYHLAVLTGNNAPGCLSEIGFVDSSDKTKLLSDSWRDKFAQAYQVALSQSLNKVCDGPGCATSQNFTSTISAGVYKASGTITASAPLANGASVVFNAGSSVALNIGFSATYDNGNAFTAQLGGCNTTSAAAVESLAYAEAEPVDALADDGIAIYPNPSSGEVNLSFTLAQPGAVSIRIFNYRGKKVDEPATQNQYDAGTHVISWNANGQHPEGTYFCAFESNGKTITKKLIIR